MHRSNQDIRSKWQQIKTYDGNNSISLQTLLGWQEDGGGCGLHQNLKVIWSSTQVCKADKIEHDNSSFFDI